MSELANAQPAATAPSGFNRPDPFNYPMPQRNDCMSLSSIQASKDGMKTTTFKFQTGRAGSNNLNTRDIDGASPKIHGSRAISDHGAATHMQNFDIERSAPRQLHMGLGNKPENNMRISDIPGAQPQCVKFKSTRMGSSFNPLNPEYKLQSVAFLEPAKPRFIRDQQNIDDIEGTKPVRKKNEEYNTRNIMMLSDIEKTSATIRHPERPAKNAQYDPINYRDVTHADFKSTRCTNPLVPTYLCRTTDDKQTVQEIGAVQGSMPCVLPPARKDENFLKTSLTTQDIHGCSIGTKGLGNFHTRVRREYKNTNITSDIFGANPGSLQKSPVTIRQTHPLDPVYQFPGRNELTNINDAFGKPRIQKVAQQVLQKVEVKPPSAPVSAKVSEKPSSQHPSQRSAAQKLDKFIS